jgi:hypothetical protein
LSSLIMMTIVIYLFGGIGVWTQGFVLFCMCSTTWAT